MKYFLSFLGILTALVFANAQVSLLPNMPIQFSINAKEKTTQSIENVEVTHENFKTAHRISTNNQTGNERLFLKYPIDATVQKGDILLLSFYARTLQSKRETGEAFLEIALDRFVEGKYNWPPVMERGLSFGSKWVLTQIPFIAAKDVSKGEMALMIKCGGFLQTFELGEISLLNYKKTVKLSDLPRSIVHYEGDTPNAAWRKTAEERIEKYRKGNLTVKVLDENGTPVSDASVVIQFKKSAFAWGTATNSQLILDSVDANAKIYRDTLLKYFNKVVFENEMKAKNWEKFNAQKTQAAVKWLKNHDIAIRGHVMVWPSWQHSPHLVQYKNDKTALNAAIFKQIQEQTTVMKGQFSEWDVVNEPFNHHNIMDSLGGKDLMRQWFDAAGKNTEGVKLFLNDYTMFHSEGAGSECAHGILRGGHPAIGFRADGPTPGNE